MPRRRKKQFPCGHRGHGQYCHRCALEQQAKEQAIAQQQQVREAQQARFEDDVIDLRGLPPAVVNRARDILAGIANGEDYRSFRGKRLQFDRTVISIPVTYRYRLICRELDDELVPWRVLSHEDYNAYARNKRSVG